MSNIYVPEIAEITKVRRETSDVKTFRLSLPEGLGYLPGQFLQVSCFGVGEAPISISSTPGREELEISVKQVGAVTENLHDAEVGDKVGVRGPYGNGFPVEDLRNRDLLFIGGGIGLAPLRSLINYSLDNRRSYGRRYILYGARTPKDLVFREELAAWSEEGDTAVHLTVDNAGKKWGGHVGVVPKLLEEVKPNLEKTTAVVCGPPVMIKFTVKSLLEKGFTGEQIIFTLERMMKCGVGKCGHCGIGGKYVCIDGPVFSYAEMKGVTEFSLG